ncbi:MAG: SpoIIE family protein phosphatase [Pseudomonadota bacterium]
MDISGDVPHVLLVADEPLQQQALAAALQSWGHDTTQVSDAAAALAWLAQMPADGRIILVDGRQRAREAIACCRSIRDQTAPACVHYLLILAETDEPLLPEAFAVGATCLLMTTQDDALLRARMFSISQRSLRQAQQQAHLHTLTQSHLRVKHDLHELASVQQQWLPDRSKRFAGIDFDWIYRPAFIVSGDHFNLMPLSETEIGFCMIDVMGHGIAAAMRALEMARSLSTHPNEGILFEPATTERPRRLRTPAEVATLLNESFKMTEVSPIYCTLIYGVLNTVTGVGAFVQAGHGGPVQIKPNGEVQAMGQGGFPVGLIDDPGYENVPLLLTPGDRLFIYSDGITESADAQARIYGEQRLLTCLAGLSGSARNQLDALDRDIALWVGAGPLDPHHDDVSMLMLNYQHTGVAMADDESARLPAEPAAARPEDMRDEVPLADARPSETIRTLIVTAASESVASMLSVLSARGLVIDLLPISDEQLDRVVLSQYQLILLSWNGDLTRQRALLQRVIEVRQACPLYVIAFALGNTARNTLDALQAGADDFVALPISLAELQCRSNAGRQWIARDRVLREELRRQQVLNEQVVSDLQMIEVFQKSRFPAQGEIHGEIESGWLYSKVGYVMADQLGITPLDDRHIAFYAIHSPVKSMLSLVAIWATSRLVSHEIMGNVLYEPAQPDGQPALIRAPNTVLNDLHLRFLGKPTAHFACAMTYGVLDTLTGQGRLAYAGEHVPMLVKADGAVVQVGSSSSPLGAVSLTTFDNHDFVLDSGDSLFLYGSGLSNLITQPGKTCCEQGLQGVLSNCHGQTALQRTLASLDAGIAQCRNHGGSDDVSVLVMQRSVMGPILRSALSHSALRTESFQQLCNQLSMLPEQAVPKSGVLLTIPVVDIELAMDIGKMAGEFALSHGLSSIDSYFMDVAVVEAATNISRHGYAQGLGKLELWMVELSGGILIRLIDQGSTIDAAILDAARRYEFPDAFDNLDSAAEGGMGLPLIFKSMDLVHYHSAAGSNSLLLFKRASGLANLIVDR